LEAKHRLVEANIRLVVNALKSYSSYALPKEDLFQEGILGLIVAAERFDPERGIRFSTYATYWIRQTMSKAIDGRSRTIRLPAHIARLITKIDRFRDSFQNQVGRGPTDEEIGSAMGLSAARVRALSKYSKDVRSIDAQQQGFTEGAFVQALVDPSFRPDQWYAIQESRRDLSRLLKKLSALERQVIELRFPRDGSRFGMSYGEVAEKLGLTKDKVRRLELGAIKKLKAIVQSQELCQMQTLL
jgi:RNA polymerase primary sigma factor